MDSGEITRFNCILQLLPFIPAKSCLPLRAALAVQKRHIMCELNVSAKWLKSVLVCNVWYLCCCCNALQSAVFCICLRAVYVTARWDCLQTYLYFIKPPPPVGAGGGYMFSGRPCVRDSCGSFVSAISPVGLSVDGFSPNFCHWCISGQRWTD